MCGNGRATKQQVQSAIQSLFKLAKPPKPDDAADAIAIAYLSSIQQY
ncbi:crossover junction endodeoxyribonuclease RuvC [Candidatus Peregrinibacteria bacterium]|nr:crossover junction endodeoxyribonuclease RuvC [Candidatus Peregrinibacteria bacterium]